MSAFPVKRAFADTLGSFGLGLARAGIFLDHESGVFHSSPQVIRLAAIMHFLTQIRRERIVIRRGYPFLLTEIAITMILTFHSIFVIDTRQPLL
jgi:hypothetical protein